jgi:hypothetical protein
VLTGEVHTGFRPNRVVVDRSLLPGQELAKRAVRPLVLVPEERRVVVDDARFTDLRVQAAHEAGHDRGALLVGELTDPASVLAPRVGAEEHTGASAHGGGRGLELAAAVSAVHGVEPCL